MLRAASFAMIPIDLIVKIMEFGGFPAEFTAGFGKVVSKKIDEAARIHFANLGRLIVANRSLCLMIERFGLGDFNPNNTSIAKETNALVRAIFVGSPEALTIPTIEEIEQIEDFHAVTIRDTWKAIFRFATHLGDPEDFISLDVKLQRYLANIPNSTRITRWEVRSRMSDEDVESFSEEIQFKIDELSFEELDEYFILWMQSKESQLSIHLDLSGTNIRYIHPALHYIEIISFTCQNCLFLTKISNHFRYRSLDQEVNVSFAGCKKLRSIESGCTTNNITTLNLSGCEELISLPDEFFNSVKIFIADFSGCKKLRALPQLIAHEGRNSTIDLTGCTALTSAQRWRFRMNEQNPRMDVKWWSWVGLYIIFPKDGTIPIAQKVVTDSPSFAQKVVTEVKSLSKKNAWLLTLSNPESSRFDGIDKKLLPEILQSKIIRIILCIVFSIFTLCLSHIAALSLPAKWIDEDKEKIRERLLKS